MKLLTYKENGIQKLGVASKDGEKVYDLARADISYRDMNDLIEHLTNEQRHKIQTLVQKEEGGIAYNEIEKCAPIPKPNQDVICLGVNYGAHVREAEKFEKKEYGKRNDAIYFSKRVNEFVPDGGIIHLHADIEHHMDYEAELAVVIGKKVEGVNVDEALDYVFGYTILNDVSARTLQRRHQQWYFGKSLDGLAPMGPWIVTADEIAGNPILNIKTFVNGELRQSACTDQLIFNIPEVISELSRGMTLLPGSIISTGTPAGVGMSYDPPRYLKAGDRVDCEIEKIGTLHNIAQ
ncbi:MAG: fumarylacetoacetate hydrolase family protein [Lachnospiraceae bacterium]|nr:fumarylacetoacetate hydrolase family protein [Lachnospiraceae bacterium]